MDIGLKIRLLREKHGLKQINLANTLQVTPQAVSKWEKGANLPDVEVLMKIARLFDVSTDHLLGLTEAESGVFPATVFCSAVTHFEKRSISMESKELADYTNVLFYDPTESILKFDGIPVKYVGDGFLCFFSGPDHADRALRAAIHAKKVIYQKDLIIALNSGSIYLGLVGHPRYAARDIVGETVNRAFLVAGWASRNCPSGVAATQAVMALAKGSYRTILHEAVNIDLIEGELDILEIHLPQ
ncbi:MAG: helix-turn-helix domain-containing protein [Syntrophorhabdaceae bacterium]|nr:helix-turn-helix domain-containing protein [Syntrophorhabdaceae bacterium]MDD4197292.1 helix-turn-helix domain-containing protein [Syntrophorhabdaceae bacterium]